MPNLTGPIVTTLLDWIGSVLMLGSLWGWVYEKFRPSIVAKLAASTRRRDALARLGSMKYGLGFRKVESIRKTFARYREIGIFEGSTTKDAIVTVWKQAWMRRRLQKYGLASNEHVEHWARERRESTEARRIIVAYWYLSKKLHYRQIADRWVESVTQALFVGRAAKVIFVIGFILWNLSKGFSLLGAIGGSVAGSV